MTQIDRAQLFARLHVKGDPLILFNIWDAGSARAVAEAGAEALATGSWSVAAAYGCDDGEGLPLDLALANAKRTISAVDLPVSIDFEGGYGKTPAAVAENGRRLIETGAVGCNFEDQIIDGEGLHTVEEQSARIAAIRQAADRAGIPFFINARTDIFLQTDAAEHGAHLDDAFRRAEAYAKAGANGFFAPGLVDAEQIRKMCAQSALPVNIMCFPGVPEPQKLATIGVARISYGPIPYRQAMAALKTAAQEVFAAKSKP